MKTGFLKNNQSKLAFVAVNALLTVEFVLLLDLIVSFLFRVSLSSVWFPVALMAFFLLFSFLPVKDLKRRMALSAVPLVIGLLITGLYFTVDLSCRKYCDYKTINYPSEKVFSDKKVMIIVPHEDDDLNLVSGVIEKYIANGSEILTVFVTNGDFFD